MKTRSINLVLMAFILLLALPQAGQARAAASPRAVAANPLLPPVDGRQPGNVVPASGTKVYLPFVSKTLDCSTGDYFGVGPAAQTEPPLNAALHPDKNPFGPARGYVVSSGPTGPVGAGGYDPCGWPPQLAELFDKPRSGFPMNTTYTFNTLYNPTRPGGPANGMTATVGELIRVPSYRCNNLGGNPVEQVLVLYADSNNITIKYTREDNIFPGYAIHLRNICVDPVLLALYNQQETAGRYTNWNDPNGYHYNLVNLRARQAIGRAATNELIVSVRDQGTFMNPRQCDWWRGYQGCP